MICPMCGCYFCYDYADMILLGADRKEFCSKACKKKHDKRIWRFGKDVKKRPHHYIKDHYGSRHLAELIAESRGWTEVNIYRCCSEGYQITRQPVRSKWTNR